MDTETVFYINVRPPIPRDGGDYFCPATGQGCKGQKCAMFIASNLICGKCPVERHCYDFGHCLRYKDFSKDDIAQLGFCNL